MNLSAVFLVAAPLAGLSRIRIFLRGLLRGRRWRWLTFLLLPLLFSLSLLPLLEVLESLLRCFVAFSWVAQVHRILWRPVVTSTLLSWKVFLVAAVPTVGNEHVLVTVLVRRSLSLLSVSAVPGASSVFFFVIARSAAALVLVMFPPPPPPLIVIGTALAFVSEKSNSSGT